MTAGDDAVVLVVQDEDSASPAEVARWLHGRLAGWPAQDALLVDAVVAELFDNAVNHGAPPYVVELHLDPWGESMTVSVRDRASTRVGAWRPGAGLLLVDALSDRWGVVSEAATTIVWARLEFED